MTPQERQDRIQKWRRGMCPGFAGRYVHSFEEVQELLGIAVELLAENEKLSSAVRNLAAQRSDATRMLPLGGEEWRAIRPALSLHVDGVVSEGWLRDRIVDVMTGRIEECDRRVLVALKAEESASAGDREDEP